MIRCSLVLILTALIFARVIAAAEPENPLEGTSFTVSATGVLITRFVPDSQGEKLGLRLGDIITTYANKPITNQDELIAAVSAAATTATTDIPVVVKRGDQVVTITAKPGKLGAYISGVEAGKHWELPPATAVTFASERLQKAPIDTWYSFFIDGKKVGAEHAQLKRVGDLLTVTVEVLFDGGKQWGLNHMIETGVLDVSGPVPRVVTQVHEGPLWSHVSSGKWKNPETWEVTIDGKNEDGSPLHEVESCPVSGPLINEYSFGYLTDLLQPTTPGTCFHSRTALVNQAKPNAWSAWLVIGPEVIDIGDQKVNAVRMERRMLMSNASVAWVADGDVVKHDYSGGKGTTISYKTTKEKALEGLDPKLVPRTGK
jgi:hypothetical protein